jgi:FkbM family methyltransferase
MKKIIDKKYIYTIVDKVSKPAPYAGPDKLFKLKQSFPKWLRSIIFSWINPFYVAFIYRKALKERDTLNYRMRNQFTISFMKYCFQNQYSLDLYKYYPEKDHKLIESYLENRVKSLFVDRHSLDSFSNYPEIHAKIEKSLSTIVKKKRDGSYTWMLGGNKYFLSSRPEISATYYKLGLPMLPEAAVLNLQNTRFLDAGAFNGDTAIACLPYKPHSIWCFEPDDYNFTLLNDTISLNKLEAIVEPYKIGIGDRNYKASFSNSGIMGSKIDETAESSIEVKTIDSLDNIQEETVGLIKLDIEGFELEAIKGAEQTIRNFKPLLIISAYHTGKDFFEIPPLLKEWVPEYTLRFFDLEPHSPMLGEKMILAYVL